MHIDPVETELDLTYLDRFKVRILLIPFLNLPSPFILYTIPQKVGVSHGHFLLAEREKYFNALL